MRKDPEIVLSLSPGDSFMMDILSNFLQNLLQSTTGFISLPTILLKILKDHRSARFGDIKWMISEMMEAYNYETNILATLNHILNDDIQHATSDLVRKSSKAIRPKSLLCLQCKKPFELLQKINSSSRVVVFRCGHGFHRACLDKPFCPLCRSGSSNEKASLVQ